MSVILDSSGMDALTSERSEKPATSHSNQPDSLSRVVCGVEEEHQSKALSPLVLPQDHPGLDQRSFFSPSVGRDSSQCFAHLHGNLPTCNGSSEICGPLCTLSPARAGRCPPSSPPQSQTPTCDCNGNVSLSLRLNQQKSFAFLVQEPPACCMPRNSHIY